MVGIVSIPDTLLIFFKGEGGATKVAEGLGGGEDGSNRGCNR